ncbi:MULTISPECIES: hypothetical protein [Deinococcus]|uniref:Uncharacterized protein n=2 Tax=Deinococcus TaxID=1298 RepID=A0A0F7JMI4_9DEIO|nr:MULTISPECIES: hypothetical protein [Deinococcus]AKH16897.1 hypothetical protein SY84_07305 [Deinococcus soli (ex Cha et al. 2016)]MDK2012322.1 hypothetical protein [Deinococcus sp. 43]
MQKVGLYALVGIMAFALIFALLPTPGLDASQSGARLSGVQLRLYPSGDANATWSFRAADVRNDPLNGLTTLTGITEGQRLLKEQVQGRFTGREILDATLATQELTIDAQDTMTTRQARITLVQQCADIDLKGTEQTPVKIEQGQGFSAPSARISSPNTNGRIGKLKMTFGFVIEDSDPANSKYTAELDATETCRDGKRVPLT